MRPDFYFNKVTCIDKKFFTDEGINALLIDVDNTLCKDEVRSLSEGVSEWVSTAKRAEIKICLVTNNNEERVKPVAVELDLPYIAKCKKPFGDGISRAMALLSARRESTAIIGDQLFTDIAAGRRAKIKTILVKPISPKEILVVRLKRIPEKIFMFWFLKTGLKIRM